ncbi:MAG: DUF5717 family protein [bacterium]|nr:DUF5717 family protein [bacterium]
MSKRIGGENTMKEKISQLAKERFEFEVPKVILSTEKLVLEVEAGKSVTATVHISNSGHRNMKGVIYSSDPSLTIQENTFVGTEADICFIYNAKNKPEYQGKKTGILTFVSNFGEYTLPFEVTIEKPYIESTAGKLYDLYHFTNLAKKDFEEALRIFKTPQFKNIILVKNEHIRLYDGLIKSPCPAQAMDEFLVAIHHKLGVTITAEQTAISYNEVRESIEDSVKLNKKEWGYVEISLKADVPFITLEQSQITSDEFEKDEYTLRYAIDYSKLPFKKNIGHIMIDTYRESIVISVEVNKEIEEHVRICETPQFKLRKYEAQLVDAYLKFRLNTITKEAYEDQLESILNTLASLKPSVLWQLWFAHLYMISGQTEKLVQIMSVFEDSEQDLLEESIPYYLAYLYLRALYTKKEEDISHANELIGDYYQNERKDWHLLWYLLYIDKSYEVDQDKRLSALMVEFVNGVNSPVLYYEALIAYNKNPELLKELGPIERRIMHWAVKHKYMSEGLVEQFLFLASRVKTFDGLLLQDLVWLYEYKQTTDSLQGVIRMLMNGRKTDSRYFKWYEAGVKKNLKITELYEYYMYSIPEEKQVTIEQSVLLYFLYNNHLPEAKKVFLYAYIIRNKETIGSVYRTYLRQMETFARRMVLKESLSENLTVLYKEFITPDVVDEELAKALPAILFRCELVCDNKKVKSIITKQEELNREESYYLEDGICLFTMATDHTQIYLVDENGNRYVSETGYKVNRLFTSEALIDACFAYNKQNIKLLVDRKNRLEKKAADGPMQEEMHFILNRLLESEEVDQTYKGSQYLSMVEYYHEKGDYKKLDEYLITLDDTYIAPRERYRMIEYLIMRDLFEPAYDRIKAYGYEMVNVKRLFKLVMHMITEPAGKQENSLLLEMCNYLYQTNNANCDILRYLIAYSEQTSECLFELYEEAKEDGLDCVQLEERLLGQILFSEHIIDGTQEVFEDFYQSSNNKLLIRAYLNYVAYRYLVHGEDNINQSICDKMKKESFYHESRVCMLAMLKYYSESKDLSEDELKFIDYNLHKFINQGIVFEFFLRYADRVELPDSICNRYYVEYVASPDSVVTIYYTRNDQVGNEAATMKNVFEGIYVKDFILFYGETLSYYVAEEKDGKEVVTKTNVITQTKCNETVNNRFDEINEILKTKEERQDDTVLELIKQYAVEDYITSSLFTPL